MTTESRLVGTTELHPSCYGDWSLCSEMEPCERTQTFLISGELANRVRERVGDNDDVLITERHWYTGYSEYTITSQWQAFTIKCGDTEITFGDDKSVDYKVGLVENPIVALEKWLNE